MFGSFPLGSFPLAGSLLTAIEVEIQLTGNSTDVNLGTILSAQSKSISLTGVQTNLEQGILVDSVHINETIISLSGVSAVFGDLTTNGEQLGSFTSIISVTDSILTDTQVSTIVTAVQNNNNQNNLNLDPVISSINSAQASIEFNTVYTQQADDLIEAAIVSINQTLTTLQTSTLPNRAELIDQLTAARDSLVAARTAVDRPAVLAAITNSTTILNSAKTLLSSFRGGSGGYGKGVARMTDVCTGHGCFPSRFSVSGSDDVTINNLPAHRVGDSWATHTCVSTHSSVLSAGSSTVFVNGRPLGRIGDTVACGSFVQSGSETVFAGD